MKKKIAYLLLIFSMISILAFSNIEAVSITANDITLGQTVYINVDLGTSVGAYNSAVLTCNGSVVKSEGLWNFDNNTINGISSKSYSYTPSTAGTYTFEFKMLGAVDFKTDDYVNGNGTITISKTITVTAPQSNNEQNNTSSNTNTTNNNNNKTNTTTNNNSTKSSNNYLKSLQISEEGLTPDFVKTKTNYTLSVGPKVTSINVNAKAEDSSATVTVSGNTDLKDGDNNIYITVVAENGNKRTYTIIVNKSADPVKSNSYLSNLIIRDMELSPVFSSEVLEYDGGTINTNETKIDIYAYPTNENAKVEIIGNENLVLGENVITIKITSEDGTSTKEYKIKFVREEATIETQALSDVEITDNEEFSIKAILKEALEVIKANALLLLMYLLVIVEFVQILYLYKKLRDKELPKEENNDSFEKYNITLDDVEENTVLEDNKLLELEETNNLEIEEETKVKTIWDEEKPDFSEELRIENESETEIEDEPKRRRGSENIDK